MERIFYKKWTAIMFVAAILILVLLVCLLLTNLVQMSALKERIATFERLLQEVEAGTKDRLDYLEYLKDDEYVRWWAEQRGLLSKDDILWLKENA